MDGVAFPSECSLWHRDQRLCSPGPSGGLRGTDHAERGGRKKATAPTGREEGGKAVSPALRQL